MGSRDTKHVMSILQFATAKQINAIVCVCVSKHSRLSTKYQKMRKVDIWQLGGGVIRGHSDTLSMSPLNRANT